ncbi:MAG: YceI family protein [Archangium sp.]|nr:YceI family protein [Archangium sp.]
MSFITLMFLLAADGGVPSSPPAAADAGVAQAKAEAAKPDGKPLELDVEEVVFHAKVPASAIDGVTKKMTAIREGDRVRFIVPLEDIETGIGLRNSHMKKYLNAEQYPNAELIVSASLLKAGVGQKGVGTFTVKGTPRDVDISYDAKKVPGGMAVQAKFAIDIKNHGIAVPTYAGITVKKDVTIETSFVVSD